ncbi:peptidoglycan-binding protein [Eubacteriales bacterium OttesenSCG-928-A19]|nr:peptidoglycan-binding protein [Eubacteriales bacterium OttesenSCG-928-A19]
MYRRGTALALAIALMLSLTTAVHAETVGYVTSTGLYIRRSPNTSAEALRCAANGEKLIILREEGDWYYVQYNEVVSGYVAKKYVSKSKSTSSGSSTSGTSTSKSSTGSSSTGSESSPSSISELGKAPASTKRGDRGNDVLKLQQALKIVGHYSGKLDGIFGEQTEVAVKKFQSARGLSKDGVAGKVTIRTLFGQDASGTTSGSSTTDTSSSTSSVSSSGVETIDWNNGGSSIIPRGATFTIKDTRTGTTIKVKNLYGSNHLDAEPLDSNETAKLKQVYGGEWSWDRRPILVNYNGRVIAASMNGMPHGEQSIYDNNFDGQFCIHFTNSKTHGSSKVDPDHQASVGEAAKASW